jgi:hypothetical protein
MIVISVIHSKTYVVTVTVEMYRENSHVNNIIYTVYLVPIDEIKRNYAILHTNYMHKLKVVI